MKVKEKSRGELALEKLQRSYNRIEELEEKEKQLKKDRGTGK